MGNSLGMLAAKEPDFQIHGLVKFQLFGQELWLTTTPTITKGIKTGKETFFSSHVPKKVHSKMGTSILMPN